MSERSIRGIDRAREALAWRLVVFAFALSALTTVAAIAQPRPNLIFILSDDQGTESIEGPYWSNEMEVATAVLARWAEQGVSFTQCRVNPNCSPTRAAMMTGRNALETGVNGALSIVIERWMQDVFALQPHERTIAEVLNELEQNAYHTILVDKWHLGYNVPHTPLDQGFDVFHNRYDYLPLDLPEATGDEHVTTMVDLAIASVQERPLNTPYALFFHTINPHRREDFDPDCVWWKVGDHLLEHTRDLPDDCGINRFKRIVEATDTELGRMLHGLGVTDSSTHAYIPESNTVVIFVSDNGTDTFVSTYGERAKNSPFEAGIRVPLFVFGAGVTGNAQIEGTADARQISHVDFYDTICDIVDASPDERGSTPRRGLSFADSIGWAEGPLPRRMYTACSLGHPDPGFSSVSLVGDPTNPGGARYKLIASAGVEGLADLAFDAFFDLESDPGEDEDLLKTFMTESQIEVYYEMRDEIVNHWAGAVMEPYDPYDLPLYAVTREVPGFSLVAYIEQDVLLARENDEFYDVRRDPDRQNNLVGQTMTRNQRVAYESMRFNLEQQFLSGELAPNGRIVTLPATDYLALRSDLTVEDGQFTLGYADFGEPHQIETRGYVRFRVENLGQLMPPGYTLQDVVDAQLVIAFDIDEDAMDVDPASEGTDTGPLRAFRVTHDWTDHARLWNAYDPDPALGFVDLPPHIIPDPVKQVRGIPLVSGAPVSFGHDDDLFNLVLTWNRHPEANHGLVVIADPLTELNDPRENDQHLHFLRNARIRLTLRK